MNTCLDCGVEIKNSSKRCRSCATTKQWHDPESRKKIAEACNAPDTRRKRLEGIMKHWRDPDARKRHSESAIKSWGDLELRQRQSEILLMYCSSPDARQKKSDYGKKRWDDPDARLKQSEALTKYCNNADVRQKKSEDAYMGWVLGYHDNDPSLKPSDLEIKLACAMDRHDVLYVQQYRPEGYTRVYDFYIPNQNLLIEVDGTYWHSRPDNIENDAEKDEMATKLGYDILRIREDILNEYGADAVVDKWIVR